MHFLNIYLTFFNSILLSKGKVLLPKHKDYKVQCSYYKMTICTKKYCSNI